MAYRIEVRPKVEKALRKLPTRIVQAVRGVIDGLANDPRPQGAKRLTERDEWRIRVGDYRILYLIEDALLVVIVVKIGHRKDVYRKR